MTTRFTHGSLATDIDGFDSLAELALNLRSSWNHATDTIWRQLDAELWEITQNPWVVLQTVARDKLEHHLADPTFRENVEGLVQLRRERMEAPAWFQETHSPEALNCVAYFSMEYMLSEALPIYSGGLGNVAGDQLKAASDLGVPVVGVGLLYQQGYFRQAIDLDGNQRALYPYNEPGQLPITPVRQPSGEIFRLEIALPGYSVWLRAWEVQIGRLKLYLLDSNDAANFPAYRGITSELYGGDSELRLKQEILLGLGGWRLLEALGIRPDVCHLNEGHAAFAILERAYAFMVESGQPFAAALAATRAGNLFTTHTAVAAGFDRFSPGLIEHNLGHYAQTKLAISIEELLALGRQNPEDRDEYFNMAFLAMRGCGAANGVSRLHGEVSRKLFAPLFPGWPQGEVPIGYVTNGIHVPSWDSAEANKLWKEACGDERWLKPSGCPDQEIRELPDAQVWQFRRAASGALLDYARQRLSNQLATSRASAEEIEAGKQFFRPDALTLGFARRFATYKRPNLLLHDPERLLRLLSDPERPVQLILAGKAHPADREGQAMISEWIRFTKRPEARSRVIFLSDYDMLMAQHLVQGVDVWVNTPRRPWEASGTSGMKVLVNGGLNLSELDGWWVEAYSPEVGWSLGDGQEHGDDPDWDAQEALELYELLEREVIPEFYARDPNGIPTAWVQRIRESMATLTARFSATRTVREYTEQHYLPAAAAARARLQDKGRVGQQMVEWRRRLEEKWGGLRFGSVKVDSRDGQHFFEVEVLLNGLTPQDVRVELYADPQGELQELEVQGQSPLYRGAVSAARPASDYTPRIVANFEGAAIPMESQLILWQK